MIMQAMIPQYPCNWGLERDAERDAALLQSSVGLFLATVLRRFAVKVCQSLSARRPSIMIIQMQHRMPVPVARPSAQAVGFTCINCDGILDSRWSVACHRRHATSKPEGTPCADPSSLKSLSFTERADKSTGILRQHPGILGEFSNCCPRCVLRALLRSLCVFSSFLVKLTYNSFNSGIIVK